MNLRTGYINDSYSESFTRLEKQISLLQNKLFNKERKESPTNCLIIEFVKKSKTALEKILDQPLNYSEYILLDTVLENETAAYLLSTNDYYKTAPMYVKQIMIHRGKCELLKIQPSDYVIAQILEYRINEATKEVEKLKNNEHVKKDISWDKIAEAVGTLNVDSEEKKIRTKKILVRS